MSESIATEAPDNIRSAILASFEPQDEPAEAEKPVAEEQSESSERARDASGRFVKAEKPEEPIEAEKPEEVKAKPEEEPKEPEEKPATFSEELSKATTRWSAEHKAMLAKLPEDAQKFLVDRWRSQEADYTRKTQEIAQFRRDYEPVHQLLSPHADMMRDKGFTPSTLIQAWYNVEKGLMQGGETAANLVAGIVQNYRIDPRVIAQKLGLGATAPQATQAAQAPPAPEGAAQPTNIPPELQQRLEAHERWIAQQEQERKQAQIAQYNRAAQDTEDSIQRFASETDSSGAPLHPYFQAVYDDMVRLAVAERASGRQPDLSKLYETAIWANPSIRQQLLDQQQAAIKAQQAAEAKKAQEEARAKAERAARASKSVTGAPGAGQAARGEPRTLKEQLESAWESTSARV